MSGFRDVLKDGWHPKGKGGGKESWRGDFKGINQVASWAGKGKSSDTTARPNHASRPLSTLQDPSSFAPPPRRSTGPDAGGLGSAQRRPQEQPSVEQSPRREDGEAVTARPRPPPVPYRTDTTGLSTSQFAKPPGRHDESSTEHGRHQGTRPKPEVKPKPALPPRLPPRGSASNPPPSQPSPPPAYEENQSAHLNQDAINRLGNAGVSVGQLGIGGARNNATGTTGAENRRSSGSQQSTPQSELQARFAKMNTSPASQQPTPATTETAASTTAAPAVQNHGQNQTAQQQRGLNRSSSDLSSGGRRSTTESSSNFRERHNDHIQSGMRKLSDFEQKYGIKKRINGFIEDQKSPAYPTQQQQSQQPPSDQSPPYHNYPANSSYSAPTQNTSRPDLEALNKRRPPPPPTPGQSQEPPSTGAAPPLPLDTKPR